MIKKMSLERDNILKSTKHLSNFGIKQTPLNSQKYDCGTFAFFTFNRKIDAQRFAKVFPSVIAGTTGRHNYTEWEQITYTRLLKKTGPPQRTEFKIIAEVPLEIKIESLEDTVIVPAGQFNKCMRIKMIGSAYKDAGNYVGLTLVNVEQTNWYSSGVGLVKMERIETTQSDALDKGTLLVELTEFESG